MRYSKLQMPTLTDVAEQRGSLLVFKRIIKEYFPLYVNLSKYITNNE